MKTNIEKLWSYACSGDIEALKKYYNEEQGEINKRYDKFGHLNSLIMGAFRNNQFDTVEYLLDKGETVTQDERKAILNKLREIELMRKIIDSNK